MVQLACLPLLHVHNNDEQQHSSSCRLCACQSTKTPQIHHFATAAKKKYTHLRERSWHHSALVVQSRTNPHSTQNQGDTSVAVVLVVMATAVSGAGVVVADAATQAIVNAIQGALANDQARQSAAAKQLQAFEDSPGFCQKLMVCCTLDSQQLYPIMWWLRCHYLHLLTLLLVYWKWVGTGLHSGHHWCTLHIQCQHTPHGSCLHLQRREAPLGCAWRLHA